MLGANLRGVDFGDMDILLLSEANFQGVLYDLDTNFPNGFDISQFDAHFIGKDTNLQSADLRSAYLRNADLRHANLNNADLRNCSLQHADLRYANLNNANFDSFVDLSNADLRHCDFSNTDLSQVLMDNTNFDESTKFPTDYIQP